MCRDILLQTPRTLGLKRQAVRLRSPNQVACLSVQGKYCGSSRKRSANTMMVKILCRDVDMVSRGKSRQRKPKSRRGKHTRHCDPGQTEAMNTTLVDRNEPRIFNIPGLLHPANCFFLQKWTVASWSARSTHGHTAFKLVYIYPLLLSVVAL